MEADLTARARRRRSMSLRSAVATGAAAKGLAVAVQLVAVGVAIRTLGPDALGSYLVMASLVAWLGLAAAGMGPGLTQRIATATANADRAGQANAFSSSVGLSGVFILVAAVAVLIVARLAFFESQSSTGEDIQTAALILGVATAAQVWFSVFEAAQLGHQEQHFANVFQSVGLASVLVILLVAGSTLATVTAFVMATAVPPLVAKLSNAALYVARRRYLVTGNVSIREAASVLSTSIAFATVQLGATASQQVGFLWLAAVAGPAATVPLGVMFRLNAAASSVVALVTQPLWPALADAIARQDTVWARQAYRRASWLTVSYAAAYAVGLMILGTSIVQWWTGAFVEVPGLMILLFGIYFVVGVWAHVNAITLVGLGNVWVAARVTCLEAVVSILGAVLLVAHLGPTGVILAMLIASATVSAILLPRAAHRSWPDAGRTASAHVMVDDAALLR